MSLALLQECPVGGTVGQRVAQVVHAAGSTVAIVEDDPARAAELIARGLQVITGNACAPGRLEAAGALHANVLAACTGREGPLGLRAGQVR